MKREMNIDHLIKYWAYLCENGDMPYLDEGRKKPTLSDQQIQTNVCRSLEQLKKQCRVNQLLFVFGDGNSKSITVRYKGHSYRLWLDKGTRSYGATKITRKHLIDGGIQYTGGFTLAELNRDINNIVTRGNVTINGNQMTITWSSPDGFDWKIGAFNLNGNRWTINTIHTSRNQSETRKSSPQTKTNKT